MNKVKRYILEGKIPVEEPDLEKWEQWYAQADRIVSYTEIPITETNRFTFKITDPDCVINVTTSFLGVDHALQGERPLLFVTKITGGQYDQRQQWTHTWEEAETEHQFSIQALNKGGFTCLLKKG